MLSMSHIRKVYRTQLVETYALDDITLEVMAGGALSEPEAVYMPFGLMVPMEIRTAGNSDGWTRQTGTGFQGSLASEQTYLQYWVELRSAADEAAYRSFIESYISDQKKVGRFGRPMNYRVSSIAALMADFQVAPKETFALLMVGLLFLAVAAVNLIGLLLGKFLARASEVGVRRALGASRRDVFLQHLVECQVVAIIGGTIGVGMAAIGLRALNAFMLDMTNRQNVFALDTGCSWGRALTMLRLEDGAVFKCSCAGASG